MSTSLRLSLFTVGVWMAASAFGDQPATLPGTEPLIMEGDLSVKMVEGIDRWLDREAVRATKARDTALELGGVKEDAKNVDLLRRIIGSSEIIESSNGFELLTTAGRSTLPVAPRTCIVERVRWPVLQGACVLSHGEGLLMRPPKAAKAAVIALPDADQTPEQFAGLEPGVPPAMQFARRLAERGFLVLVPTLVDRRDTWSESELIPRVSNAPHREWIYRQSFESGRTIIGYEVEKVIAGERCMRASGLLADRASIGIAGYGEGGVVALFAAATSHGFHSIWLAGCLNREEQRWRLPIYRNLFGFSRAFDDRILLAMTLRQGGAVLEDLPMPQVAGPPPAQGRRRGAAPGMLGQETALPLPLLGIGASAERAAVLYAKPFENAELPGKEGTAVGQLAALMGVDIGEVIPVVPAFAPDPKESSERQRRGVKELQDRSQSLMRSSELVRKERPLWAKLKPGPEWNAVQTEARQEFWEKVVGKLSTDYLPSKPRSRQVYDRETWRGYDVMLDVHPDIFAWGVLLVPKDLKARERRPVVVCQHGLEGVPADTITDDQGTAAWKAYKGFAARLVERGFIVYAPHNPYRGHDKFRWLQRKANPLGLSLFSFIIAQHDVTTRWLASLPFVDPERIAFYGLSYGGKTAMRVPAVLDRYCLSICSGDFNEWVLKCVSDAHPSGYIFTPEWEIWEWALSHTFNYAEMALLIAPRPFMVERGHNDGVGLDEHVGYEWAKVLRGYTKLGIADRAEIEWFDGPHTINGQRTFRFLHKHLRWPER